MGGKRIIIEVSVATLMLVSHLYLACKIVFTLLPQGGRTPGRSAHCRTHTNTEDRKPLAVFSNSALNYLTTLETVKENSFSSTPRSSLMQGIIFFLRQSSFLRDLLQELTLKMFSEICHVSLACAWYSYAFHSPNSPLVHVCVLLMHVCMCVCVCAHECVLRVHMCFCCSQS